MAKKKGAKDVGASSTDQNNVRNANTYNGGSGAHVATGANARQQRCALCSTHFATGVSLVRKHQSSYTSRARRTAAQQTTHAHKGVVWQPWRRPRAPVQRTLDKPPASGNSRVKVASIELMDNPADQTHTHTHTKTKKRDPGWGPHVRSKSVAQRSPSVKHAAIAVVSTTDVRRRPQAERVSALLPRTRPHPLRPTNQPPAYKAAQRPPTPSHPTRHHHLPRFSLHLGARRCRRRRRRPPGAPRRHRRRQHQRQRRAHLPHPPHRGGTRRRALRAPPPN